MLTNNMHGTVTLDTSNSIIYTGINDKHTFTASVCQVQRLMASV